MLRYIPISFHGFFFFPENYLQAVIDNPKLMRDEEVEMHFTAKIELFTAEIIDLPKSRTTIRSEGTIPRNAFSIERKQLAAFDLLCRTLEIRRWIEQVCISAEENNFNQILFRFSRMKIS